MNETESESILTNYATLLARVLIGKFTYFNKVFKDCVVDHIEHMYSDEMEQKSNVVGH